MNTMTGVELEDVPPLDFPQFHWSNYGTASTPIGMAMSKAPPDTVGLLERQLQRRLMIDTLNDIGPGHPLWKPSMGNYREADVDSLANQLDTYEQQMKEATMAQPITKRIVRVYLADPDDRLPVEKSLLYSGDEQLTDMNDAELYFNINISELLARHNATRATVRDKKASEKAGKDVFLEAVRIRDLKMVVVTIASF